MKYKSTVPPKLCKKTADATGFSERTVNRVVAEKRELDGSLFPSPSKRYKKTRERVIVDDFDTERAAQVHKSTATMIQQDLMQPYPYTLYNVM